MKSTHTVSIGVDVSDPWAVADIKTQSAAVEREFRTQEGDRDIYGHLVRMRFFDPRAGEHRTIYVPVNDFRQLAEAMKVEQYR
jgi:hypothetical protein